jgi:GrpB-like predicted nucleotidyltransferase (UPF0157 family)
MTDELVISAYDPAWPLRFGQERERILAAVGAYIEDVQHIGSTSVPGLGAKPIIDLQVSVRDLAAVALCVAPLTDIGYEYLGEYGVPGRHYFHKPAQRLFAERTHHLQIVEQGGEQWRNCLIFRDYLRTHPEVAQSYERLKRDLANQFGTDREGYTAAKTAFVQAVLDAARSNLAHP